MSGGSYSILGGDFNRAGAASRSLKDRLKRIGVQAEIVRRAMIAAYEAEMNVVIHAHRGTMRFTLEPAQIDIEILDEGPGIPDIEKAMQEGFSTAPPAARELGFGAGMGLPNIKRYSDRFRIQSTVGHGTRVSIQIDLKSQTVPASAHNSLHVAVESCRQCLHCVRACPTKAVRVRGGRPEVLDHLCIDCGVCIDACKSGGLTVAGAGPLPKQLNDVLCVVPASFLAQFGTGIGPGQVLEALKALGFRDVVVTDAHEQALRDAVARYAQDGAKGRPVISPVCPAVVNLVEMRFQSLITHLAPFLSPIEAVRQELAGEKCLFVVACPCQCTALTTGSPATADIVTPPTMRQAVARLVGERTRDLAEAAPSASEAGDGPKQGLEVLQVSGMRHVMNVLEKAENGFLGDVPVLELYACDQGCLGSPLLWDDPFVARRQARHSPRVSGKPAEALRRNGPFLARSGLRLDPDMSKAIMKLGQIDEIARSLPGRNCGLCGAPTCAALAEDIVLGVAFRSACTHLADRQEKTK